MKIGIDVQPLQTGTRLAGVGRYLHNVLTHLARQDSEHAYTLFLNSADYLEPCESPSTQWETFEVPRKLRLGRFWWWWDTLYLPYALVKQQIDVYHYNSLSEAEPMAPPFPIGSHRVVATIHDLIPLRLPELYPEQGKCSGWNFNFAAKLRRLRHADAIMTVSECSKRDIVECLNYPEDRIFVAYNGIAPEFFQEPTPEALSELTRKYTLPDTFMLYLGGYYSLRKNIDRLFDAYTILLRQDPSNCPKLVLAGLSNAAHKARIRMLINKKELVEHVLCLPHIPDHELPLLYRLTTLFVYPSLYEGFGLPVADAMACGAIVATSSCSSLPEIGGDACLYFDPYNPRSIAETMHKGLTNMNIRAILFQKGLQQARKFSWERSAKIVLSVYARVYDS